MNQSLGSDCDTSVGELEVESLRGWFRMKGIKTLLALFDSSDSQSRIKKKKKNRKSTTVFGTLLTLQINFKTI